MRKFDDFEERRAIVSKNILEGNLSDAKCRAKRASKNRQKQDRERIQMICSEREQNKIGKTLI